MNQPEPHPDTSQAYHALKQIQRGAMQAVEDKAIDAYMRAYEEVGKEEAERIYFSFFNNKSHERNRGKTEGNRG